MRNMVHDTKTDPTRTLKLKVGDRREYLNSVLDILMAVHPNREKVRLDKREAKYLVESVALEIEQGIGMGSKENVEIMMDILEYKRATSIYNLRYQLKSKGWVKEDDEGYHYVPQLMLDRISLDFR